MLLNGRNEVASNTHEKKSHLSSRNYFAKHCSCRWQRIFLTNNENLRVHQTHLVLEFLEGLFVPSASAILNSYSHSLRIVRALSVIVRSLWLFAYGLIRNVDFNILSFVEVFSRNVRVLFSRLLSLFNWLGSSHDTSYILEESEPDTDDHKVAEKSLYRTSSSIHI